MGGGGFASKPRQQNINRKPWFNLETSVKMRGAKDEWMYGVEVKRMRSEEKEEKEW